MRPDGSDEIVAYLQTAAFEANPAATGRREADVGLVGAVRRTGAGESRWTNYALTR